MIFSPHVLQKKVVIGGGIIGGNPVPGEEEWVDVGKCRCDDNGQQIKVSVNGILFDYNYHIVHVSESIPIGTEIRVMDGDSVRGEGKVIKSGKCNYFDYCEIWV